MPSGEAISISNAPQTMIQRAQKRRLKMVGAGKPSAYSPGDDP
jgi:hypothetical protein